MPANLINFFQNHKKYYVKKCYIYKFLNSKSNSIYNNFNFGFIINIFIAIYPTVYAGGSPSSSIL